MLVGTRKADQELHYPLSPAAARATVLRWSAATSSLPEAYGQGGPWPAPQATTLGEVF